MPLPFSLSVPLESNLRSLATDVAAKYAELLGGGPADAEGLAAAVAGALDSLAAGAKPGAHADLKFRRDPDGIHIEVRSGDRSSVVKHLLPAAKR
jgi:hypothetical protein